MNLVIDKGNTLTKLAVFSGDVMTVRFTEDDLTTKTLKRIFSEFPGINSSIFSTVSGYDKDILDFLSSSVPLFINLDYRTPLPVTNKYNSKETLGNDRIANAVGAITIFPGNNVLVIDAGTAITFDIVTSAGEYLGGNISPGLDLRFKALNQYTANLPLVSKSDSFELTGTNTIDAILSGVLNSVIFEIEGYISRTSCNFSNIKTVLTGGDCKYLVKNIKNTIFVDPDINLTGLNQILKFNAK